MLESLAMVLERLIALEPMLKALISLVHSVSVLIVLCIISYCLFK